MRKPVVGWEGFYEVSDAGEVFSISRTVVRSDKTIQTWKAKQLRAMVNSKGYLVVRLSRPSHRKVARVHRLVAEAFLPNLASLPEVNHLDGNKANAAVANLEWCTPSENRAHAFHILGSITMPRICVHSDDIIKALKADRAGKAYGYTRLAKMYGIPRSSVRMLLGRSPSAPTPEGEAK